MAHWRSGLTHIPLKDTFIGPNPIWVTNLPLTRDTYCIHYVNGILIDMKPYFTKWWNWYYK